MRSISARLTAAYALSATATLAILFVLGYQLLQGNLIAGLDRLTYSEFGQIKAHLGKGYDRLSSAEIDDRLRETSQYASVLFYIAIENPKSNVKFASGNLHGATIPDIKGKRSYNTGVRGVGELRVSEFLLPPLDVTVGTPIRQVREGMRSYVRVCAALLAVMLLASLGIGFGLSRLLLRPVRLIRETAHRIGSDNLSERIAVADVHDEISDLARLLNQTFDRLESAFNQVRRFSDEASHELKTPLSLIRLHAEKMLGDGNLGAAEAEAVVIQIEEVARLNQIIDELLFLSRAEAAAIVFDLQPQAPDRLLESFRQDTTVLAEHHGKRFALTHSGAGQVAFEEKWLRQVLLNVLTNALAVSPPAGLIALRSVIGGGEWRVSIEDQGPGLPTPQHTRIFERFVRFDTPPQGDRGSGLGLAICQSIIELHHGTIHAEPGAHGRGLRIVFSLPARPSPGLASRDR